MYIRFFPLPLVPTESLTLPTEKKKSYECNKIKCFKYFNSDFLLNIGCNEMTEKAVVNHQNNNDISERKKICYSGKLLTIMKNVKIPLLLIMLK